MQIVSGARNSFVHLNGISFRLQIGAVCCGDGRLTQVTNDGSDDADDDNDDGDGSEHTRYDDEERVG